MGNLQKKRKTTGEKPPWRTGAKVAKTQVMIFLPLGLGVVLYLPNNQGQIPQKTSCHVSFCHGFSVLISAPCCAAPSRDPLSASLALPQQGAITPSGKSKWRLSNGGLRPLSAICMHTIVYKLQPFRATFYPKNLLRLFLPQKLFLFSEVIFKDPPKIPFKTSIKITSRVFFFYLLRLFLPREVIPNK